MRRWTAVAGAVLALGLGLPRAALAQWLDEVDVRALSDAHVVRLRFNTPVAFVSQQPGGVAERFIVRFEMIGADEQLLRQALEEMRRVPAQAGLPGLTVTHVPVVGELERQLSVEFERPVAMQARQGANARAIELVVRDEAPAAPAPAETPAPAATAELPPLPAQEETERRAAEAMVRFREARLAGRKEEALDALGEVLRLPPNRQSRSAQEVIGQVWESLGEPERARTEYALYLRLYPQGEGAWRVADRLKALGAPPPPEPEAGAPPEPPVLRQRYNGSIAQYLSAGKAKSHSLVNIASGIDQATLSRTTESALVTSVDLGGRWNDDGSETRAVVRGTGSLSLGAQGHGTNALSAAYVDWHRLPDGLAVRAGRQSPLSGGLLGLFDGVSLAWPAGGGLKFDLMGGLPANPLVSAPGERLLAAVVEADSVFDRWGGNVYLLRQTTEGLLNRQALGAELRYAGERWSLNTLLDYDTQFAQVNAFSMHASVQAPGQSTFTVLADRRRAPSLQLTNALISSGAASLKTLLQTRTLAQVKQDALATSALAQQLLLSVARPVDEHWQMAMDLRYSAIGALPAVGDFEATPATGAQYTYSMQLTGSRLYSARDVNSFNFSVTSTPFFKGWQLAYNNVTVPEDLQTLSIEPSLRLYGQRDNQQVQLWRLGPGVRSSWRWTPRTSLLGELLVETSRSNGPTNRDRTQSVYFYLGYRHELF